MVALPPIPYRSDIVPLESRFSHREPPQLIKINTAESVCIADPAVFYYACALLSPFLARIFCFILFEFCIKKVCVNYHVKGKAGLCIKDVAFELISETKGNELVHDYLISAHSRCHKKYLLDENGVQEENATIWIANGKRNLDNEWQTNRNKLWSSRLERFAENNITFIYHLWRSDNTNINHQTPYYIIDPNRDGQTNLKDVTLLRQFIAEQGNNADDKTKSKYDVNGDSSIDLKDVTLLRRYIAGGWY